MVKISTGLKIALASLVFVLFAYQQSGAERQKTGIYAAFGAKNYKDLLEKVKKVPRIHCKKALQLHEAGQVILLMTQSAGKPMERARIVGAYEFPDTAIVRPEVKLPFPKDALILTY